MASVNKVILVGNLGADPESRFFPDGTPVCNIRLATTESWKDKNSGEKKEATEWHRVAFQGGLAEVAGKYLRKGSQVYIEGKITTRKWQNKDGVDQYTTEIRAHEMKMLGGKKDSDQSGDTQGHSGDPYPKQDAKPQGSSQGGFDVMEDDIPF